MRYRLAVILIMLYVATLGAQTVSNIKVTQDPELGYYKISFDLSGKADELYTIKLVPYKAGKELGNPFSAQGAGISVPIKPSNNRTILWSPFLEGVDKDGWSFRLQAVLLPMIFVQGGSFMMGSNEGESDEKPVHQVTVSDFYIGKYEVTQKEWVEVMGNNPSNWKGDNLPVECVSWLDAVDYCNKRSIKEGLQPCYSGSGNSLSCNFNANGYRLPTEAEWEYAARGGSNSKGYKYSGSNNLSEVAWWNGNSGSKTHPAGTKTANELGIYDMSGNVWEWCWDWYDSGYYAKSQSSDPQGVGSGRSRVLRGGSWCDNGSNCRVAFRNNYYSGNGSSYFGFRVLRAK